MLRGKDYNGIVVEFGECVLYKIPGLQPKLATRWEKGVWLGKRNSTDEHLVGTEDGTTTARTVQRRPEEHRWSKDVFQKLVATPSQPRGLHDGREAEPRQKYITKAIMDRLGRTAGCGACEGARRPHTEECRARFETLLRAEEAATPVALPTVAEAPPADAQLAAPLPAAAAAEPAAAPSSAAAASSSTGDVRMAPTPAAGRRMTVQERMAIVFDEDMSAQEEQAADDLMDPTPLLRVLGDALEHKPKKSRTIGGRAVNIASRAILVMALVTSYVGPVYGAISGELLDPELVALGRKRESENSWTSSASTAGSECKTLEGRRSAANGLRTTRTSARSALCGHVWLRWRLLGTFDTTPSQAHRR